MDKEEQDPGRYGGLEGQDQEAQGAPDCWTAWGEKEEGQYYTIIIIVIVDLEVMMLMMMVVMIMTMMVMMMISTFHPSETGEGGANQTTEWREEEFEGERKIGKKVVVSVLLAGIIIYIITW